MGSLGARRLTASLRSAPSSLRNSTSTDSEYSSWNSLMSLTAPQYQRAQTAARWQHRRLIGKAGEPTSMVSKWHGNGKVSLQLEQLQLGGAGEIATAVGADDHEVLDPDGSPAGVVEPRLDGHDLAGPEPGPGLADAGGLVNVQAHPVSGAVEESLQPAVHRPGRAPAARRGAAPLRVDRPARRPVPHELDTAELGGQDGVVHPPEIVRRLPLDHGPSAPPRKTAGWARPARGCTKRI